MHQQNKPREHTANTLNTNVIYERNKPVSLERFRHNKVFLNVTILRREVFRATEGDFRKATNSTGNLETKLFTAQWCQRCRDIAEIVEKSGLKHESIRLDDSPASLARLKEAIDSTEVPSFKAGANPLIGYYPKQLSILLKINLEGRDHPAHPLSRQNNSKQQEGKVPH
ncbi:MAG: hypothetical protein HYU39_05795 [Thaumarchaeota archaeon]|nr:hypothetical protein [Nitrososphaerota archaeon]